MPANITKYAAASLIGLAFIIGLTMLAFALTMSQRKSAVMEMKVKRLEQEIEPLKAERDSIYVVTRLRGDSLRASRQVTDSLFASNARLRLALRRMDVDTRPDFSFSGTDSSLAAVADSILRSRGGYD